MWRSGVIRRRRQSALAALVEHAVHTGDFAQPWDAVPDVWEHYADVADVLRDLQHKWRTALAGEIYLAIESGDGDLPHDVLAALRKVRRRHHGVRQILEVHAAHPAIAAAMRKERSLLSCLAGVLDDDSPRAA
jgi:hypothetical protein